MAINWQIKTLAELTQHELYEILRTRQDVFVVEQNCPYADIDGTDAKWMHVFAEQDGRILAYARLRLQNEKQEPIARIGRVLVKNNARGQGLARELMRRAVEYIHTSAPERTIELSVQVYLLDFYRSFGFVEVNYEYLEDNIPHHDMEWRA